MPHTRSQVSELQRCTVHCLECHRMCMQTLIAGLDRWGSAGAREGAVSSGRGGGSAGGGGGEPEVFRALLDAAQICQLTADLLTRASDLHPHACELCAEGCDRAAAVLDRPGFGGDPALRACGEVARRCAESCREMSGE